MGEGWQNRIDREDRWRCYQHPGSDRTAQLQIRLGDICFASINLILEIIPKNFEQ